MDRELKAKFNKLIKSGGYKLDKRTKDMLYHLYILGYIEGVKSLT